jgi:hypothetical protein
MMNKIILLICFILMSSQVSAKKLPCLDLEPDDNPTIAYKQRGNRCEGFYQCPVSTESLTLVGLSYGKLEFDAKKNEDLYVVVPRAVGQQVHIQGVGVPLETYYRLDAWGRPEKSFLWPLDIIRKKQMTSADIGLLGTLVADPKIYTPLAFGDSVNSLASLNLTLRPLVDLSSIQWRVSSMDKGQCGHPIKKEWKEIRPDWGDGFYAGTPLLLPLQGQKENFCIQFAVKAVNSRLRKKPQFKIFLKE